MGRRCRIDRRAPGDDHRSRGGFKRSIRLVCSVGFFRTDRARRFRHVAPFVRTVASHIRILLARSATNADPS